MLPRVREVLYRNPCAVVRVVIEIMVRSRGEMVDVVEIGGWQFIEPVEWRLSRRFIACGISVMKVIGECEVDGRD